MTDEPVDKAVAALRARWLAGHLNDIASALEAGGDPPGARRVTGALRGFVGTTREKDLERLERVMFVSALQCGAAMRVVALLARRDRGEPMSEGEAERVAELDKIMHRVTVGEELLHKMASPVDRDALAMKAAWDEDARVKGSPLSSSAAGPVGDEHCVAMARAAFAVLFPDRATTISDAAWLEALAAFDRRGGGAKLPRGTPTKWEQIIDVLTKAGMRKVDGQTLETDWKDWNKGLMFDEPKD